MRKIIKDQTRGHKGVHFNPAQVLAVSFLGAIAVGAGLLMIPACTVGGRISWIDALFTSASAVCVTGLIVQDTPVYFTPLGQAVILILFQLGGLGIMTFSTLVMVMTGRRISFKDRIIVQEGFHHASPSNLKSLIRNIFLFTFGLEIAGAGCLYFYWKDDFSGFQAAFHAVFHSVSAFCNAGFARFSDSFESFRGDLVVNGVLVVLIILGGLGFLVLNETFEILADKFRKKRHRLSLHMRMVLCITSALLLGSAALFFILEYAGALQNLPLIEKITTAFFQVVTPRTAGFNTIDLHLLGQGTIFMLIMLMFVGAAPGSTGGGVKITTLGVLFAFIKSRLAGRRLVNLNRRTLPFELITKAFTLLALSFMVISLAVFILMISHPDMTFREIIFEAFSAFGTVGLSLGITPELNPLGKTVIILTMYIGRIGPLSFLYAFSRERPVGRYDYAEESVMIG
ncbi:MAG: TrkH family potassium uptake protein [Candidatus Aminicenantes bacterium]